MYDLIFALLLAGAAGLALALAYLLFCLFLYVIYRMDGGKMGLISYLNKM